ncbi:MAG: hypothetical protein JXA13_12290 [Anaerolineales bacterium]|nr:hypothetical protein [Anaerolineales bacterium]
MDRYRSWKRFVLPIVLAFVGLSCGIGDSFSPLSVSTDTPVPTNTATPRPTSTPRPTTTPQPTATEAPPTPIPAPMGTPVSNGDYEVNVVSMRTLNTVYLDKIFQWVPTAGNMFVELGIKVVNLKPGAAVSVPWGQVHIIEENGDTWYPNWGEFKPVESGIEVSPKSLMFRMLEDPAEEVVFDEVVFIRAIYGVAKHNPTTLLFGFGDSPLIVVVVP